MHKLKVCLEKDNNVMEKIIEIDENLPLSEISSFAKTLLNQVFFFLLMTFFKKDLNCLIRRRNSLQLR